MEEGDSCFMAGCCGRMFFPPAENCSCHISPPCQACVSNELLCNECLMSESELEYANLPGEWLDELLLARDRIAELEAENALMKEKAATSFNAFWNGGWYEKVEE